MSVVLVVLAVLGGLVLLLAVPLDLAFGLEGVEPFQGRITIRWLFGLVRVRLRIPGARSAREPEAERRAPRKRAGHRRRGGRGSRLAVLRQAAFRERVYRLVADLVRAVHLRQLSLFVRLGLGDPADTGRLWAVVGPLSAFARGLPGAEVRIEPEFVEPVLEFQARGRARIVPLQLLALAIAFALSPPSMRAWRTLVVGHA